MIDISINQTFETSSDSIATDNVKTKIEIIVASKIEFSINAKTEIIVASKIEFFNAEINAYNQTFLFERIDKKRKHYKTVSLFEIHFFQFTLFLQSFTKRFRFSLENFNQFNWNVSINQLFSINLIDKVKIIRHLYVRHFETKFSDIVHEIVQFIIDHFRESDEKNIENYEYQFFSFKFIELSFIDSLFSFQISSSSDFFDFFRLIARIFFSKLSCQKNLHFNSMSKTFFSSFSFSLLSFFESSSKSVIFQDISSEIERWKTFLSERVCENSFKRRFQLKMRTMICVASRCVQLWTTICIMTSKIWMSLRTSERKSSKFANSRNSVHSWLSIANLNLSKFSFALTSMSMTSSFETSLTNLSFIHSIQRWTKIDSFTSISRVFQNSLVFSLIVEFRSMNFLTITRKMISRTFFRTLFIHMKFNAQIFLKLRSSAILILFF